MHSADSLIIVTVPTGHGLEGLGQRPLLEREAERDRVYKGLRLQTRAGIIAGAEGMVALANVQIC